MRDKDTEGDHKVISLPIFLDFENAVRVSNAIKRVELELDFEQS